jgi:DNA-binding NarL/FixJ family response regulator
MCKKHPGRGTCVTSSRSPGRGKLARERSVAIPAHCGTVLIADEDGDSRRTLTRLFESAGYEVTTVNSGAAALQTADEVEPSIVLLEIPLGDISGYEVCRVLREQAAELPIVFVSGSRTESYDRVAGLLVGADDYVTKPYASDELLTRVRNLLRRPPARPAAAQLTKREREVLQLLADGLRRDDIAKRLVITPRTVGAHVENILRKLGVQNQAQAVARAFREDLVEITV